MKGSVGILLLIISFCHTLNILPL